MCKRGLFGGIVGSIFAVGGYGRRTESCTNGNAAVVDERVVKAMKVPERHRGAEALHHVSYYIPSPLVVMATEITL